MTMRTAAAISLALGGAALLPSAAGATFAGEPGLIAYQDFRAGLPMIHTVRPDGTRARIVVENGLLPAWSRDGRRLAFHHDGGLWQARADGSAMREVLSREELGALGTRGTAVDPAWAPSGRRIAFTLQHDDGGSPEPEPLYTVYTVRLDGTGLNALGSGTDPAWSPVRRRVAFSSGGRIVWTRPDGSGRQMLARPGFVTALDFSPDGRRLVYLNREGTGLETLDIETREVRPIDSRVTGRPLDVRWTPGGRRIAFIYRRNFRSDLRTIRPSGGGLRTLFTFPRRFYISAFAWQSR